MVNKENLKKLLNLNIVDLTNQSHSVGCYDLPYVSCPDFDGPDYLALYSEKRNYSKTEKTALCFYQYDSVFDGPKGIYSAIYYDDKALLAKYKSRFENVRYAIAPDFSQCGDVPKIENLYRLFKSRVVANWLLLECNILTIPNVTYSDKSYFDVMLDGMEECEIVAFSTKGVMRFSAERKAMQQAIKYTVDNLKKLKTIIVYSDLSNDSEVFNLFNYASKHKIKIVIPDNLLKHRNTIRTKEKDYGENKK